MAAVSTALVSLWSHKASTAEKHYVGCGVFVADGRILTAAHVVRDDCARWVRAAAGGIQAFPLKGQALYHPSLDIALVRVDVMPGGASALDCDLHTPSAQVRLTLNGFFEGRQEAPQALEILSFDSDDGHYLSSLKHPVGHSGSAVCHDARLWGIATAHRNDPNVHRGCIVALAQCWDWLEPLLPPRAEPVGAPPTAGCTAGLSAACIARFRSRLGQALAYPSVRQVLQLSADLPDSTIACLQNVRPDTGEQCVEELIGITRTLAEALADPQFAPTPHERIGLRRKLLGAMGCAARMCLDADAVPSQPQTRWPAIDVAADTTQGATLAIRDEPDKNWVVKLRAGLPTVVDQNAIELPIELGEGRDAERELAKAVYASLSHTGEVPKEITPEMLTHLQGLVYSEGREGRARFLVLGRNDATKLAPPVQEWLRHTLSVGTLRLSGSDGRLFLFPENHLFGRLQEFLRLLEKLEWKS